MKKIAILTLTTVLVSIYAVGGILAQVQYEMSLTTIQAEMLMASPGIAILITGLLSNTMVKRLGLKTTTLLGLCLAAVSSIVPIFSVGYALLLTSRIVFGLALGLFNPLSVSYISYLFEKSEVPKLLGYRVAIEAFSLSALTIISGWLLGFGSNLGFLIYLVTIPILVMFWTSIPNIEVPEETVNDGEQKQTKQIIIWGIGIFVTIMVTAGFAVMMRFSLIASEILGEVTNASIIMAIQPLFNIIPCLLYGKLDRWLGKKLLYFGIFAMLLSMLAVGFSSNSYPLAVLGLFLHGIVFSIIMPYVFNFIDRISSGKTQNFAVAVALGGSNLAAFASPFVLNWIERGFGFTNLTDAFKVLAALVAITLIAIIAMTNKIKKATSN